MITRRTLLGAAGAAGAATAAAPVLAPERAQAFGHLRVLGPGSTATIVLPAAPTLPETTAANELSDYLTRRTGASVSVVHEPSYPSPTGERFYVGATQFAASAGVVVAAMVEEQWRIVVNGLDVILTGGGVRGTLYATYRFLEDLLGIRWWNPFEDYVPPQSTLSLGNQDVTGKPALTYRDVYISYGNDEGRFVARNRINRDGDTPISAAFGGSDNYGPPYHVHTFFRILPPDTYYATHPDWYLGGVGTTVPTASTGQLHLSNTAMRAEFISRLRQFITDSDAAAAAAGVPAPRVFSVSQEDNGLSLIGDSADAAFVTAHGGAESALLVDFVNWIADQVAMSHPGVVIDTLAYWQTLDPPAGLTLRANTLLRLVENKNDVLHPWTDSRNAYFRNSIDVWKPIATGGIRVWDYTIAYRVPAAPLPNLETYPADIAYCHANGVTGIFNEMEHQLTSDQRDLKLWVWAKLVEDPTLSLSALVTDFTDKYYGPAAGKVRDYLALVRAAAVAADPDFSYYWMGIDRYTFLTRQFLLDAHAIFDDAAGLVATDTVLSRRVRRARFAIDEATLMLFPRLVREWVAAGNTVATFGIDRQVLSDRRYTCQSEQIGVWLPAPEQYPARVQAAYDTDRWTRGPVFAPPPAHFATTAPQDLVIYDAATTRNYQDLARVITDPTAESGSATRYAFVPGEPRLPFGAGVYQTDNREYLLVGEIPASAIAAGYNWYKIVDKTTLADLTLTNDLAYLWVGNHWNIQVDLNNVFDPGQPSRACEVWLRLKFEGASFPGGSGDDIVHLERAVLRKL